MAIVAAAISAAVLLPALAQPASGPQEARPAPKQQPGEEGKDRGPRRGPLTRQEWRDRLTQRQEELRALQQRVDEAQAMLGNAELTDQQIADKMEEMRPSVRWFLMRGIGDRGDRGGGGGGDGHGEFGDRGGGPWSGRGDDPDAGRPATKEDVDKAIAWVGEHMPRLAPRLTELNEKDPEAVKRIVQRMRGRIAEMERLAKDNPQAAKARIEEWQAGMRVVDTSRALREHIRSKADQSVIDKAREDVRAALVAQFDAQANVQENDLTDLKEKVQSLEERLDSRRAGREKWLEDRLKDIESGKDRHGPPGERSEKDRK